MNQKNNKNTLRIFYYIFILFGLSMIAIDPLIPVIAEQLSVGYDKIGIALFIGSVFTLISTFLSGRLSDKFEIKKIIVFGLVLISFGFFIFGIFLNYIIFITVLLLIRSGFGTIDTSIHAFSSRLFNKNISRVFVNLDILWFAGAAASPLLVSLILYLNIKPKFLFLLLSFSFVISTLFFYKVCPKKNYWSNNENNHDYSGTEKFMPAIKNPVVILASFILFSFIGAITGFTSWMTTYFLAFNIKVATSSIFLSFYWAFSIVGLILINRLLKKNKEMNLLLAGCISGTVCMAIFAFIPNLYIKIIALVLQAIFYSGIFPLSISISSHESIENSGSILGFNIAFAYSGSVMFQPLFGYVAEYIGKEYTIFLALIGAVISLILTFILFKTVRKKYDYIKIIKN